MIKPRTGNLLIAPPKMTDPRFDQSVLLLTHHFNGGSFALCINKPTQFTLEDISVELELERPLYFPLYWGGPVTQSSIWMLHHPDWELENTIRVNENWSLTSNQSMFHHIADGDAPNYFRFMHGFSSWAPGQLEAELKGNPPWTPKSSWLVAEDPGAEWLFECPEENMWEHATELCSSQAVDNWL
jgi:putative transcriptional regulator